MKYRLEQAEMDDRRESSMGYSLDLGSGEERTSMKGF